MSEPMSEHDIEQIARVLAEVFRKRPVSLAFNPDIAGSFYPHARAILPLIASAREEGAKSMQERAVKVTGSFLMTKTSVRVEHVVDIEQAIRALPLKEG